MKILLFMSLMPCLAAASPAADFAVAGVDTPSLFQVGPTTRPEQTEPLRVRTGSHAPMPRPDTIYLQTENERPTFSMGERTGTYEELKYIPMRAGNRVEVYLRFFRFSVLPDTLILERNYAGKPNFTRVRYLTRPQLEDQIGSDSTLRLVDQYPVSMQAESNYRVWYVSSSGVAKTGSARMMNQQIPADADERHALAMRHLQPSPVHRPREPVRREQTVAAHQAPQSDAEPTSESPGMDFDFFAQSRGEFLMVEVTGGDDAMFDRIDGITLHTRVSEDGSRYVTIFEKGLADVTKEAGRIFLMHPLVDIPSSDDVYRFDLLDDGEVIHSLEGIFTVESGVNEGP